MPAPPIDYSLAPSDVRPYSEYNIHTMRPNYTPVSISNLQVFADVTAIQSATMEETDDPNAQGSLFVIGPHTLWGDYPPKIAEPEINPEAETGEIVLRQVVIPEYVIVHDGPPTDTTVPIIMLNSEIILKMLLQVRYMQPGLNRPYRLMSSPFFLLL